MKPGAFHLLGIWSTTGLNLHAPRCTTGNDLQSQCNVYQNSDDIHRSRKRPWIARAIIRRKRCQSVYNKSLGSDTRPGRTAEPEIGPHSYNSLPFDNRAKHIHGRKEPLQQAAPRKPDIHTRKNGMRSSLLPCTEEINSEGIKEEGKAKPLQDEVQSKIFWLELQ